MDSAVETVKSWTTSINTYHQIVEDIFEFVSRIRLSLCWLERLLFSQFIEIQEPKNIIWLTFWAFFCYSIKSVKRKIYQNPFTKSVTFHPIKL